MTWAIDTGPAGLEKQAMLDTLAAVRTDIDARLAQAARDWQCPMHTPVIATADADARVMVLRHFDPAAKVLRFHTDARAPKAGVIGEGAPVGVLFYDQPQKVQIRCRGTGRIVRTGAEVDAAWLASSRFARRCYLGEGPGSATPVASSGLPAAFEGVEPGEADLIPARANFALLLVEVTSFDWFRLAHTGHSRAVFDQDGARWVTP